MPVKTYEQGLQEGKIKTLSIQSQSHTDRLNGHDKRLRLLERVAWALVAVPVVISVLLFLIEVLPLLARIAEIKA